VRAAAELVARTASILLESVSRAEQAGARAEAAERRSALTSALAAGAGAPGTILVHHGDELLHLVGADGAVVRLGGSILTYGTTLDGPTAVAVADRLLDGGAEPVATDCLADVDPAWARLVDVAAGALVAPVGKDGESWLLWTAGELRRTVTWGGDPENKELRITDQGPRLNPRRSFEAWTEELSGRSRLWSPVEIEVAGSLARNVADQLLRRSVARDQVAGALARTLLLERIPDLPGLRVAVRYLPAADSAFGGDWYDVLYRPDGHVAFALGDVAGHGIEAASITAQLRQGLRAYLLGEPSPATVLSRLNDLCTWVLPDDMATALVVDVDPSSGAYTWASAGHLPPLLAGAGGSLLAGQRGPALGLVDGATYRVNEGRLSGDDLLVLYSDGLIERRDTSIDERLRALSSAMPPSGRAPGALCDLAIQAMGASAGSDDVTVLAFGLAEA
jgi:chemotaxis family two-component system sensor kinase Cph1